MDVRDGGPYLDIEQAMERENRRAEVENRDPDYSGILSTSNFVPNPIEGSRGDERSDDGEDPVGNAPGSDNSGGDVEKQPELPFVDPDEEEEEPPL